MGVLLLNHLQNNGLAMTDAITKTKNDVIQSQREMVRTCERAGINRKSLAALLGVEESYIRHIMSDSSVFAASARVDRALMSVCSAIDQDQHIEGLLPNHKYVAALGRDRLNGSYVDEIRDTAEINGEISREERARDHMRLRDYFRRLKDVAIRGEQEAALKIRATAA